MLSDELI